MRQRTRRDGAAPSTAPHSAHAASAVDVADSFGLAVTMAEVEIRQFETLLCIGAESRRRTFDVGVATGPVQLPFCFCLVVPHIVRIGLLMFRAHLAVLVSGAALVALSPSVNAQTEWSESDLRSHLVRQWSVLVNQIVTAEIEFTKGAIVVSNPTMSLQEVNALIAKHDLANHPENREAFTQDVLQGTAPMGDPWMERKLYVKGNKVRDEGMFSIVSTPDHLAYHDSGNKHVTVFAAGRSQLSFHTLNDFLRLPIDAENVVQTWPIELDADTGGIRLHPLPSGTGDLSGCYDLVDFSTGIPIQWTTVSNGRLISEAQCHSIVELPGGIPFPMLTVYALFREERLSRLDVYLIKSIRVNDELSDALFQMSAEAGDAVFDYRFEERRAAKLQYSVPDVVAFFDGGGVGQPAFAPPPGTAGLSLQKILLFINGAILVFGGIVLWRRAHTSRSHDS